MFPSSTRRDFLHVLLGGATGWSLSSRAFGQEPHAHATQPSPGRRTTGAKHHHAALTTARLSDSLVLITGAGGNVVVGIGPDGLAMVNGGQVRPQIRRRQLRTPGTL